MSSVQTIAQVYKRNSRSFLKHLESSESIDEQSIHKLRVDIKNLRILLLLSKALLKDDLKRKTHLKLLTPVFDKAGQIRKNELNLKLAQPLRRNSIVAFRNHLKAGKSKDEKHFLKVLQHFEGKKFEKRSQKLHSDLKKTTTNQVAEVIQQISKNELNKIRIILVGAKEDKDLHILRKKLKVLKNLEGILIDLGLFDARKSVFKRVQSIYKNIGEWHDRISFAKALEVFLKRNQSATTNDLQFLNKLIEENNKQRGILFKKLKTQIK